ncbi:MAG: ABC transporter substrate-binding protein, partial [Blautia sp.]|nr:ABC transporter substrate-binding protein [Blautia sp.]
GEKTGTAAKAQEKQPVQDGKESSVARIQVTDMAGNEIALDEPVKSIVAINPADCEVLFDIGAADLLVGRGEYCDYPAEALEIECVQADDKIDLARVIKLKPEILVVNSTALTEEEARAVTAAGIRIVISDPKVIEEIYTAIFNLAELTGKVEEAEEILDHMMDTFDALREAAKESSSPEDKKSIYFEISPLKFGLWTAGKGTFMNEIAEMLNLKNIFSDKTGYKEVTEKEVTGRNPDYIVTVAKAIGEGPTPEEEILTRQGWEYVNAIYFEAILNMPDSELTRPVPRLADAAREIFNYIYNGIV